MDNNEQKNDNGLQKELDRQIQLVVNRPASNETTIDLGMVIYHMKRRRRLFAWVLVLCLLIGITAPLLLYQFTRPFLTVSSVATLRYEVPIKVQRVDEFSRTIMVVPENPKYEMVEDLTAPDGEPLDLNQITSSYVLQTALDNMTLSQPVTAATLRGNITIQTVLTEESSRTKEALQGLAGAKDAEAYTRLESAKMKYKNRFIVTLRNGFGDEDSRIKLELKDDELKMLLDRVLTVYNEYLVRTYADLRLPEDKFSAIDIQELDFMDSLDELRSGVQVLLDYCEEKTDNVKEYRSWKTGRSLIDWMETLKTFQRINIDYLYTMVSENTVTRDKSALLTSYKYLLRNAQNDLQKINEQIEETEKILKNYKNDDIYISMQESDDTRSTKASTEYYNELILQQTKNYDQAKELKITVADYTERILRLEDAKETEVTDIIEEELARSVSTAQSLYDQIREHMEELFESPLYTTYEEHSMPQGKLPGFLAASAKKMLIGAVIGIVFACILWFLAGLSPEFSKNRKVPETGKEAANK